MKKKWPGPGDDDSHVGGFNDLVTKMWSPKTLVAAADDKKHDN